MSKFTRLYTKEGRNLKGRPWSEYPRPLLKRDSYMSLNGEWDFAVTDECVSPANYDSKIRVPFPPQSMLSGYTGTIQPGSFLWYSKHVVMPEGFRTGRIILNVEAADQVAAVFVNSRQVGSHRGGYESFSIDITNAVGVSDDFDLVISVFDEGEDSTLPFGLQSDSPDGIYKTNISGIWQSVWLECVPDRYIQSIKVTASSNFADVEIEGIEAGLLILETEEGRRGFEIEDGKTHIYFEDPHLWSPEDPYLYHFTIRAGSDRVESYFALRTIEIKEVDGIKRICLNGKPYFFNGVLDKGYWSDGLYTPASPINYINEIGWLKSLGFNTIRKYVKIEPDLFYYICDRLGMVVFQDMVSNVPAEDRLVPGFMRRRGDTGMTQDVETRADFEKEMVRTVRMLNNHPCICMWTIFNEGWGQFCTSALYDKLKSVDPTRLVDSASGWYHGGKTDVASEHIFRRRLPHPKSDIPYMVTAFGGYNWKPAGHCENEESNFGFEKFKTRKDYIVAVRALYEKEVLPLIDSGLCGVIYAQAADNEDEYDGLVSCDRMVNKILPKEIADVMAKLVIRKKHRDQQ